MTRKITRGVARIKTGLQEKLLLGNLNSKRDWGYAPEFVEGMWKMLQLDEPDDFVLATGETHTVREFTEIAFKELDIELEWTETGIDEKGVDRKTGTIRVSIDTKYFRPTEVDLLIGDASKAKEKLNWTSKVRFHELVKIMTKADFDKVVRRGY